MCVRLPAVVEGHWLELGQALSSGKRTPRTEVRTRILLGINWDKLDKLG